MRWPPLMLLLFAALVSRADILHMRDGSRHYGSVVAEDATEIVFRVSLSDGRSQAVRRFPRALVERLERSTATRPVAESAAADTPQVAIDPPSHSSRGLLEVAFRQLDSGEYKEALKGLALAVRQADEPQRAELERLCRAARDESLPDLIARLRLETGLTPGRTRLLRITHVSSYEAAALGRLLERRAAELLQQAYAGRSIENWATGIERYTRLQPDARAMVEDARLAAAMIGIRLRYDPRVKDDRSTRSSLARLQGQLARFTAEVSHIEGFTSIGTIDDPTDPAFAAAQGLARSSSQPASAPSQQPVAGGDDGAAPPEESP